jgi:UTP--glucose-1-phosphate uridylyltransferase
MVIRKAVIPAAGLGTRMLPATKSQPKEMLPVGRKPAIQYVVEELEAIGIKQILIITGQKKRAIEDHFDRDMELIRYLEERENYDLIEALKHEEYNVQLFYTRQSEQKGTAHAISLAEDFVNEEPFIICLGDAIIKSPQPGSLLRRLIATHEKRKSAVTIAFREVSRENVTKYGIADPDTKHNYDSEFKLAGLIEKPTLDEAPSNLAISARYVFSPKIFDAIRKTPVNKGEYQITDSIRILMEDNEVWGVKLTSEESRFDVGSYKSYFEAFLSFAFEDEDFGEDLREYAANLLGIDSRSHK